VANERNLILRIVSGVVGLPLLGALILWRQSAGFALLCAVAAAAALIEYTGITLKERSAGERAWVVLVGVALAAGLYLAPELSVVWVMASVVLVAALAVVRPGDIPGAGGRLGAAGFGVFYVGALIASLPLLHRDAPDGRLWVIVAVAVTFINDTGAYFAGRALGKHKLAPSISPSKTVEGWIGGLLAGIGFMFVSRATFFERLTIPDCIVVGVVAGVIGPLGDLVESLLKRSGGVKDSGRLIPGHGGMLDRIDAVLFVGAYVYVHVRLFH
jgi:phosphatidate cytidylyltransferase